MKENTLYILDSYGLIYRAYFAFISRPLINDRGQNVSAVFGFFRNYLKILKDYKPQFAVAAFDSRIPTFRHKLFEDYKATRPKTPEDLHAQIPVIEDILNALGIPILRCDGYEADDVIATFAKLCKQKDWDCRILSGDKDLMQLVDDNVSVLKPDRQGGWQSIDTQGVIQEWGIKPSQMQDYLALTGDSADNIPGVKGIGDKTALKLLAEYGSLDAIYQNAPDIAGAVGKKIVDGKEDAYFSHKLVELCENVPIDTDFSAFTTGNLDYHKASQVLLQAGVPAVAKQYAQVAGIELDETHITRATDTLKMEGAVDQHNQIKGAILRDEPSFEEYTQNTGTYTAITDVQELQRMVDILLEKKCIAFDCETTSLDTLSCNLVGFSFAYQKGEAVYVPLITPNSNSLMAEPLVSKKDALVQLERIFSNPAMTIITHNGKFDYQVLVSQGLNPPKCVLYDTMIAAWLLSSDFSGYSLEALAKSKLGLLSIPFEKLVPKSAKSMTFADVPLEQATPYAAEDSDLTLQLWQYFEPLLHKHQLFDLFTTLEMPLLPILACMEMEGIHIDKQQFADYSVELKKDIATVQGEIFDLVGHEFNISSPKQLQEILFEQLKLPKGKKIKTGFSTDTAILEELAKIHPVAQKILDYRSLTKLLSTYVDALPQLADKKDRIHTSLIQTGTATGRLSSREPNLQNIPIRDEAGRKIRSAFCASEGKVLISADYAQIELVILAHLSGDKALQQAFNEGVDVHKRTASLIFGVEQEDVTSDMRRTAKTINFGVMYGMSAFRLSNELSIPRATAAQFIESYFATYSGIQSFITQTILSAEEKGFVETLFGRKRFIPTISSKSKLEKASAERIAINTPIQGSAADIVKKAMVTLSSQLANTQSSAKMLLQVHDELIFECPKDDAPKLCQMIKHTMETITPLSVPLRVSIETGNNWGMFH
ncbi:MAG: DNA polymerase I [Treponemataceae bacterium]